MEPRDPSMLPNEEVKDQTMNEEVTASVPESLQQCEPEVPDETADEVAAKQEPMSKTEILDALKAISEKDAADITTEEVSHLKQKFYSIRNEEQRQEREAFVAAGNQEEAYTAAADEAEVSRLAAPDATIYEPTSL
ncbi:MAG: hypothetical protein K2O30_08480, partial [Duncaniella sp.]|nr:hypothetical protein [Duncaniella sp.]